MGERIAVETIQAALLESGRRCGRPSSRRTATADGDARLVAYLVPSRMARPTTSELRYVVLARAARRARCRRDSSCWTPSRSTRMARWTGRRLPAAGRGRVRSSTSRSSTPRTAREAARGGHVDRTSLALSPIGVEDDFFDLGGDSLLVVEMLTRVATKAWGVEVAGG